MDLELNTANVKVMLKSDGEIQLRCDNEYFDPDDIELLQEKGYKIMMIEIWDNTLFVNIRERVKA